MKKKKKSENVLLFKENYNRDLTIKENRAKLEALGVKISKSTYHRWVQEFASDEKVLIEVPRSLAERVRTYIKNLED